MPRIDITEENMVEKTKEAFSKIEKPVTIKDFYVNNLLDAADRIYKNYKGTEEQKNELAGLLQTEAWESKENGGLAFFTNNADNLITNALKNSGIEATKTASQKLVDIRLPKIHNFPLDKKVATEFTAIVSASVCSAIDSKATALGIMKPVAANTVNEKQKELVETGANR